MYIRRIPFHFKSITVVQKLCLTISQHPTAGFAIINIAVIIAATTVGFILSCKGMHRYQKTHYFLCLAIISKTDSNLFQMTESQEHPFSFESLSNTVNYD